MGSSASVELTETKYDIEGCKALFGEAFDEVKFNEAKDEEGFVSSQKIKEALSATSSVEQPFDFLKFRSGLPDCCTAKPDGYKVVAENDTGRLVEMTLKAGDEDPAHDHPKHYMYIVAGGTLAITDYATGVAGETQTIELPAGAPPIMPAGPHQVKNVGETDVVVIFVEVSGKYTSSPEGLKSPCDTDPGCYKSLASDEDWFTGLMEMEPGAKDSPHGHRDHLLYVLEGDMLTVNNLGPDMAPLEGEGPPAKIEAEIAPGAAMSVPAGHHWVENTGKKACKIVFFEPLK